MSRISARNSSVLLGADFGVLVQVQSGQRLHNPEVANPMMMKLMNVKNTLEKSMSPTISHG
jgi:hypothetical protein